MYFGVCYMWFIYTYISKHKVHETNGIILIFLFQRVTLQISLLCSAVLWDEGSQESGRSSWLSAAFREPAGEGRGALENLHPNAELGCSWNFISTSQPSLLHRSPGRSCRIPVPLKFQWPARRRGYCRSQWRDTGNTKDKPWILLGSAFLLPWYWRWFNQRSCQCICCQCIWCSISAALELTPVTFSYQTILYFPVLLTTGNTSSRAWTGISPLTASKPKSPPIEAAI